jgi:4'-phosphopantetheinyl transferase EntD
MSVWTPPAETPRRVDARPRLRQLAPQSVFLSESEFWPTEAAHPDEEREAMRRGFGPKRLAEFRAGRWCAHRALEQAGLGETPVPIALTREPVWPAEFVGSITHCTGYCAAAVASAGKFRGIGIDAEVPSEVTLELAAEICRPEELAEVKRLPCPSALALCLMFSAKESVFKALFPRERVFLVFQDVRLSFDFASGRFEIGGPVLGIIEAARRLGGRFALGSERVITLAAVGVAENQGTMLSKFF